MSLMRRLIGDRDRTSRRSRNCNRNRLRPGLESLEQRKVLSTVGGTFEGMTWTYHEAAGTGTLTMVSHPGSARVDFQAQHQDLSPGDPGYVPNVNPINGIVWTNQSNQDQGGVNVTVGTRVQIVVERDSGDDVFVNDESTFNMTVVPRTSSAPQPVSEVGTFDGMGWNYSYSPAGNAWNLTVYDRPGSDQISIVQKATPTGQRLGFAMNGAVILGPTLATGSSGQIVVYKNAGDNTIQNTTSASMTTPARTTSQTGTTVGLNWRYTYDYSTNIGTLSVQDRPGLSPTFINPGPCGNVLTFTQGSTINTGPGIVHGANVNVVVARNASDSVVLDDHYGPTTFVPRTQTGTFEGLSWEFDYDIVGQTGTLTFVSQPGSKRIDITAQHQDLSPGDRGYLANSNPINGITWTDQSGENSGSVNFAVGTTISIVIKEKSGDDSIVCDESSFSVTTRPR
jgi:hypothetical protein